MGEVARALKVSANVLHRFGDANFGKHQATPFLGSGKRAGRSITSQIWNIFVRCARLTNGRRPNDLFATSIV